jgi:1-phosphatidylinositol phosphodiesterase
MLKRLAIICLAGSVLSALPCEAAGIPTRFGLYNNTRLKMTTRVKVENSSDWEGQRPDDNFNVRAIGPLSGSVQPEELNPKATTANFEVLVSFANGDVVTFKADQKNAVSLEEYEARKLSLSGPQAARYIASLVTLQDRTLAVSITPRQNLSRWMGALPDDLLISRLAIPGTHDSASLRESGFSFGFAKTQDSNLGEQLKLGVRFFDIRLNKDLDVYHGPIFQDLKFSEVVSICVNFLRTNPTETVLMLINASDIRKNNKNPSLFARAVYNATNAGTGPWAVGAKVPTLREVRGKIVLLRRYPSGSTPDIGIDVTDWPDDTRYVTRTNPDGVTYAIQDHWQCCASAGGKTDKKNEIRAQLDRAANSAKTQPATLFFNFISASRFPLADPRDNAQLFNPFLLGSLVSSPGRVRKGILALDFVEWEQTKLLPSLNDPQALVQQILSYNLN